MVVAFNPSSGLGGGVYTPPKEKIFITPEPLGVLPRNFASVNKFLLDNFWQKNFFHTSSSYDVITCKQKVIDKRNQLLLITQVLEVV